MFTHKQCAHPTGLLARLPTGTTTTMKKNKKKKEEKNDYFYLYRMRKKKKEIAKAGANERKECSSFLSGRRQSCRHRDPPPHLDLNTQKRTNRKRKQKYTNIFENSNKHSILKDYLQSLSCHGWLQQHQQHTIFFWHSLSLSKDHSEKAPLTRGCARRASIRTARKTERFFASIHSCAVTFSTSVLVLFILILVASH